MIAELVIQPSAKSMPYEAIITPLSRGIPAVSQHDLKGVRELEHCSQK